MVPNSSTVLVIIGGIALLIGLLGGGIEVSQIKFPHLDKWQRIFAGLVGAFLIGLGLVLDPSVRNPMLDSAIVTPTAAVAPAVAILITPGSGSSTGSEVAVSDLPLLNSPSSESATDTAPANSQATSLIEPLLLPVDTPAPETTNTSLLPSTPTAPSAEATPTFLIALTPIDEVLPRDTLSPFPTTRAATFTPESKRADTPPPSPTILAVTFTPDEDWHQGLNYAPDKNLGCNDSVGGNYQPPGCADVLTDGQSEFVSILLLERAKTDLDQQKMDILWQEITAMAPKVFRGGYNIDPSFSQAYLVYDPVGAFTNDKRWDIVEIEYGSAKGRFYIILPGRYSGSIPDGMEAIRVY